MSTTAIPFPSLRVTAASVIVSAVTLAFLVYWVMVNPAQSKWVLVAVQVACVLALAASLLSLTSRGPRVAKKAWDFWGPVVGFFVCAGLGWCVVALAVPQMILVEGRANIGQRTPAIALEASTQLRANPFNVWGTIRTLDPVFISSPAAADVAVFQRAHEAGVRSEVIDRVLANGIVRYGDDRALVEAMLVAQSNGTANLADLMVEATALR